MSVSIRRSQKISEKAEACPNDNFSCWYCDFKSNSKTAIDSHLSTHVFQKPMHYCPECDFSADRPSSVVNHIIKIHADTTNNLSGKSMNCSKSTASMSIASPLLQCKPNDFEEPTVLAANNEQIAVKQINNNGTSKYTPKIKSIKSRVLSFDIKESQEKSVNLVARVRNRGTLKCPICEKNFLNKFTLKHHVHLHKINERKCNLCNFTCDRKKLMRMHMEMHLKKGFLCDHCSEMFISSQDKIKHMQVSHKDSVKPFSCTLCSFSCDFERSLFMHNLRSHREALKLNTPEGKPPKNHKNKNPFICDVCNYSTHYKTNFMQHYRIHTGEKPFKCSYCPYSAIQRSSLMAHLTRHTLEHKFQCTKCYSKFRLSGHLKRHMEKHSARKSFFCDVCDKSFKSKNNMESHKKLHSVEKHCVTCNRYFLYSRAFKVHMKSHANPNKRKKKFPLKCKTQSNFINLKSTKLVSKNCRRKSQESTKTETQDSSAESAVRGNIFDIFSSYINVPQGSYKKSPEDKALVDSPMDTENNFVVRDGIFGNVAYDKNSVSLPIKDPLESNQTLESVKQKCVTSFSVTSINHVIINLKRQHTKNEKTLEKKCCKRKSEKQMVWSNIKQTKLQNLEKSTGDLQTTKSSSSQSPVSTMETSGVHNKDKYINLDSNSLVVKKKRGRPPGKLSLNTPKMNTEKSSDTEMLQLDNCTSSTKPVCASNNFTTMLAYSPCKEKGVLDSSSELSVSVVCKRRGRPPRSQFPHQNCNTPKSDAKNAADVNSQMMSLPNCTSSKDLLSATNSSVNKAHSEDPNSLVVHKKRGRPPRKLSSNQDFNPPIPNAKKTSDSGMLPPSNYMNYTTNMEPANTRVDIHVGANGLEITELNKKKSGKRRKKEEDIHFHKNNHKDSKLPSMVEHDLASDYETGDENSSVNTSKLHIKLPLNTNCTNSISENEVKECTFCTVKFDSRKALRSHMKVHRELSSYTCKVCGESFPFRASLKLHSKDNHSNELANMTKTDHPQTSQLVTSNPTNPQIPLNIEIIDSLLCDLLQPLKESYSASQKLANKNAILNAIVGEENEPMNKLTSLITSNKYNFLEVNHKFCVSENIKSNVNMEKHCAAENSRVIDRLNSEDVLKQHKSGPNMDMLNSVKINSSELDKGNKQCLFERNQWCINNVNGTAAEDASPVGDAMCSIGGRDQQIDESSGEMVQVSVGQESLSDREMVQTAVGDDESVSNEEMVQTAVGDDETVSNEMVQTAVGDDQSVSNEEIVQTAVGDDESVSNEELVQDELVENQQSKEPISYIDLIRPYMRIYSQEELEMLSSLNE